jgi:hypothetical protein
MTLRDSEVFERGSFRKGEEEIRPILSNLLKG